jgi:hypothetical protein
VIDAASGDGAIGNMPHCATPRAIAVVEMDVRVLRKEVDCQSNKTRTVQSTG